MKLMNFRSLAEFIQPQVQQLSGKEASINTLVVAIKRFSDTLSNSKSPDASIVLKDARISLSSGIVDVTIRAPRTQFSAIVKELSEAAGYFFFSSRRRHTRLQGDWSSDVCSSD